MVSLSDYKVGAAIAVSDMAAARSFYEGKLGLIVADDSGDNVQYVCAEGTVMHVFASPHAGTATSTQAGWAVDDLETTVKELRDRGVTFVQYNEPPVVTDANGIASFAGGAKVAYFTDPDGNILSISQAPDVESTRRSPLGAADVATRLPAQDLERARRFYADKLGLEPVEEREGGLRYRCGNSYFALFTSIGKPSGEHTQMGWEVENIERVVDELRRRGVVFEEIHVPGLETVNGIADVAGNYPSKGIGERAAWFHDSEGNLIGLGEPVRAAASGVRALRRALDHDATQ